MPREQTFAFPDTNIFLHFQFFTEIDWNEVLQTKSTTLVIPPIILKELDKHKYNHTSEKIRERADKVPKRLFEFINPKSQVRPKVNIQFERIEPQIEFEKYNLSTDAQDDHLIASIFRFQEENGNKAILITDDSALKLKAYLLGIEVVELPETFRIKHEINSDKKEIEKLKNELTKLQTKIPKLKLVSLDGQKNISCQTLSYEKLSADNLNSELDKVKKKYHLLEILETSPTKRTIKLKSDKESRLGELITDTVEFKLHSGEIRKTHRKNVESYNKQLEDFYIEYEKFLKEKYRINTLRSRIVILQLKLENEGMTPATGIKVILNFPSNFKVTTKTTIFSYPDEIKPPRFIHIWDIFGMDSQIGKSFQTQNYLSDHLLTPKISHVIPFWEKVIVEKKDSVYSASFQSIKLNHGYSVDCPETIYIAFSEDSNVKPFQLDYKITADNLHEPTIGKLNIKIAK